MARSLRSTLGLFAFAIGPFAAILAGCSKKEPPAPPAPVVAPTPPKPKVHVPLSRVNDSHRDGSTLVLAKNGARTVAYIADEDDSSVRAVDVATAELLSRTEVDGKPGQMIVDKAGRLYVALRTDQAVVVLEATDDIHAPLDPTARIVTSGVEPLALALTPDDGTLLVSTAWGHTLEGYVVQTTQRRFAIDVAREPRAITVSDDGKTAYVAHASASHLSAIALPTSAAENETHEVKKLDLGMPSFSVVRRGGRRNDPSLMLFFKVDDTALGDDFDRGFRCGTGMMHTEVTFPARVSRQGFALAKLHVQPTKAQIAKAKHASPTATESDLIASLLEERILAPHMAVATGDATVRSTGYGGGGLDEAELIPAEMFDIDVVSTAKGTRMTGPMGAVNGNLRAGPNACRLPRAAVADDAHQRLFVSCLGVDKIMEYDATGNTPAGGFKRAIDVGSGPSGMAIDPSSEKAVVWSSFDRVLNVFSIAEPAVADDAKAKTAAKPAAPAPVEVTKIAIPAPGSPMSAEAALGQKLFHKANNTKVARDGRVCASCHPDGRDDGLVWSTPDGPRQTILLAGRVDRETPFGWLGKHGSLKEHITITMKNLKGSGASDEELTALVAWLRAMPAPPRAKNVSLGAKEEHGRQLFNSSALQCGTCHAEKTGFSDREAHDVASATGADVSRQFLVPSLRFVGGSGPYFHDGRYASLGELLQKNEKMGDTKSLPQEDRDALEAYLRTL